MGVLLQANYRRSAHTSVPSPADGDPSVPWWWDRLAGFTVVLLPTSQSGRHVVLVSEERRQPGIAPSRSGATATLGSTPEEQKATGSVGIAGTFQQATSDCRGVRNGRANFPRR